MYYIFAVRVQFSKIPDCASRRMLLRHQRMKLPADLMNEIDFLNFWMFTDMSIINIDAMYEKINDLNNDQNTSH